MSPSRTPLTPARIITTAIAIADRDGLDAVSMRTVAAQLDVMPMALYKHVRDKSALLGGMIDAIVASYPEPPADLVNPSGACDSDAEFVFTLDLLLNAFERLHSAGWSSTEQHRG